MKVVGFIGPSGVGKTTLLEGVIKAFRAKGQRVSVIKHAHKSFEIDHEGKDSWRHRQAGAYEVVIASGHRLAKMREFETRMDLTVHDLLAEVQDCDWVLFEGYKHADLSKIELWRAPVRDVPLYPQDPFVIAVVTDAPQALPEPAPCPVFTLDDPGAIVAWLLASGDRHVYRRPVTHA